MNDLIGWLFTGVFSALLSVGMNPSDSNSNPVAVAVNGTFGKICGLVWLSPKNAKHNIIYINIIRTSSKYSKNYRARYWRLW